MPGNLRLNSEEQGSMDRFSMMHKAIVQSMLAQPFRRHADMEDLIKRCCRHISEIYTPNETLNMVVGLINGKLQDFDMGIRSGLDEETGEKWWAFVNTSEDPSASLIASTHSIPELSFLNRLIRRMVRDREGKRYSIGSIRALGERPPQGCTRMEAQRILDQFVQESWLNLSPDGRYCLGLRTLLELGPYLKTRYEDDIVECTLCMDMITRGRRCPNTQCAARLHHYCATQYFDGLPLPSQLCPTCKTPWPNGIGKVFGVSLTREWDLEDYEDDEEGREYEDGESEGEEEVSEAGEEDVMVASLPVVDD
ncbi:hypothetical protein BJ684DRAFT_18509 [Piptocephalis cylindrospora]|uniref:Non-structural maintenance of chromosomes element 1 homolog n=1 Tax=Piptocephalis cylindrospora TaxID=1907219 RepID=A0A4P9Y7S0_9FUNG|nr:hypothetical protein BJ684DRAFT_18509 [Piptocephalis cylindrospora]|eukprot:RKP15138.1 hypothetical protein BJ684DRAFT_18509 [Piptocephalis cylindrospora]